MYFIEIVVPDEEDCYNLLKDLNNPVDSTLIPVGVVRDFVSRPKLSQYRALQFECIIKGKDRIRVHILSEEMHERKQSLLSIDELREIYSPVLFHDFDLIDEATRSSSDRFIQSVMSQVFSKKMQIHSPKKNEVYVPYDFTALDAAIYLYPEKIKYISKILVNHTPATFDQELHPNDIIEVTF